MINHKPLGRSIGRSFAWSIGLWFAIANSLLAQSALERLEQRLGGEASRPAPAAGVNQPYLGFRGDTSVDGGVEVLAVDRGGPAELAGIRVGDVITRFDTTQVAGLATLSRAIAGARAGQTVPIKLRRVRTSIATTMRLGRVAGNAPETPLASSGTAPTENPESARGSLGVSVVQMTEAARIANNLRVRQGALITAVAPGGAAHKAGVRVGSVVTAVDGRRVQKPEDLIAIINASRIGQTLQLSLYEGEVLQVRSVVLAPRAVATPSGLENRFGEGGRRPVLGALGRLLDDVVGKRPAPLAGPVPRPAAAPLPGTRLPGGALPTDGDLPGVSSLDRTTPPRLDSGDTAVLIEQIRALQETISRLERRVARLEGPLGVKEAAPEAEDLPAPKLPVPPPPKPAPAKPELAPPKVDT
jgi:hypothetical protein